MKTTRIRICFWIFSCLTTFGALGCGEPMDDAQGGVVILNADHQTTPPVHRSPRDPNTYEMDIPKPVQATNVRPATPIITLIESEMGVVSGPSHTVDSPTRPEDQVNTASDNAIIERGRALMEQNLFMRAVSVASSEEQVFLATAGNGTISLAGYDEQLRAQFIVEMPVSFENHHCENSLKVLYQRQYVALVERSCGDEVEVSIRAFSTMGESLGDGVRIPIDEPGRISISGDVGGIVVLSVGAEQATWYEILVESGLNRTITQTLDIEEGDRRLQNIAHVGSRALLQYSDGLMRRVSYAIRCGTTYELNFRIESSNTTQNEIFRWDQYSTSYLRYGGLVDGGELIESIPLRVGPDDEQMTVLTMERNDTVNDYQRAHVLRSVDGPRILYNNYSSDEYQLYGPTGAEEIVGEKRLHGHLSRTWPILGGTGSLLLFQGRCNDYLYAHHY